MLWTCVRQPGLNLALAPDVRQLQPALPASSLLFPASSPLFPASALLLSSSFCDCRLRDRLQLPSLPALTPLYEGHAEHVDPEASPAVRPSLRQLHPALAVHLGEGLREGRWRRGRSPGLQSTRNRVYLSSGCRCRSGPPPPTGPGTGRTGLQANCNLAPGVN